MKQRMKYRGLWIISGLFLVGFVFQTGSLGQDKAGAANVYDEIAGDYEFTMEGKVNILTFFVRDGVLMGRAENDRDEEEVVLKPVEGRELGFETTNAEGMFIELTFSRDESGKIAKCLINAMGMEIQGLKIR